MTMINTLWFGERLGPLERLSIASARAVGHNVTLYSYDHSNLQGVPEGVDLRDAREVMSDPQRIRLLEGKFTAIGANFFRYEMLHKRLGLWSDLDVIYVRPLKFEEDYVFGWENTSISVNNAILKLPPGALLDELRSIPNENWCPPYFGPKRRVMYLRKRMKGSVSLDELPWGSTGPAMLTFLLKKYNLLHKSQDRHVFYPVPYNRAEVFLSKTEDVHKYVHEDTLAIHMWNSRLRASLDDPPPAGSYLAKLCRDLDVPWMA